MCVQFALSMVVCLWQTNFAVGKLALNLTIGGAPTIVLSLFALSKNAKTRQSSAWLTITSFRIGRFQ